MSNLFNTWWPWSKNAAVNIAWLIAAIISAITLYHLIVGDQSDIQITDIKMDCERSDGNCLLTFTAVNNGAGTGIVKDVTLRVAETNNQMTIVPSPIFGNDTIDIRDLYSPGQERVARINMEVQPKETEVFTVLLRGTAGGYRSRSWLFRVRLHMSDGGVINIKGTVKAEMNAE